jgi:selenide,water dikinase
MLEMAVRSGEKVILYYDKLPLYNDALMMYQKGVTTKSNPANRKLVADKMTIKNSLTSYAEELLYDPQTSGGLLLAVPEIQAEKLIAALKAAGVDTAIQVGHIEEGPTGITVV